MSVTAVCGLPGSGKTLLTTYFMLKHYKKMNKFKSKKKKINSIYTNFPVKLDKEHYSKPIGLYDINLEHSWEPNAVIAIDEVQLYVDSLEFKDFPKTIRNTFQLHRHFGISDIYLDTQHPSRMVKPLRILCSKFIDVVGFVKIPFTPFALFYYNVYYNYEDFGKSVKVNKSDVSYKFSKRFLIMNYKKVFKAYDTIYMNNLVSDKPLYDSKEFDSKLMSKSDINATFDIDEADDRFLKKSKRTEKARKDQLSVVSSFQEDQKSSSFKADISQVLPKVVEEVKQPLDNKVASISPEGPNKQVGDLQENDFIKWSPVDNKPTNDIFSLIDNIEKNDNCEKDDGINDVLDSFW